MLSSHCDRFGESYHGENSGPAADVVEPWGVVFSAPMDPAVRLFASLRCGKATAIIVEWFFGEASRGTPADARLVPESGVVYGAYRYHTYMQQL